jgi:cytochrome c-type biogenesis protein CcmH
MIWFWLVAGLLILAALITLLRPLVRGAAASAGSSEPVTAIYRRELANIDHEMAQGRLAAEQAADARAEITRRMLAAADRQGQDSTASGGKPAEMSRRIGAALGIAALLPMAAFAIYAAVGMPAATGPARTVAAPAAPAAAPQDRAELSAAADQLKARLQREPGQKEGWVLLGRALASLGRFAEAKEAYTQATALAPEEKALHAEFGEVLVVAAGGAVTAEAEAEFARSGKDPRARFYVAEAALQRGDAATAATGLKALLADAPADAPWRKAVAERLAEIVPTEPQPGAKPGAGPTPQDVAAAQAMSPEERQAMIRGMVDRLAARLEQSPNDKEGWVRLAHAYDVLGEKEKAAAARRRAEAAGPPATAPQPSQK